MPPQPPDAPTYLALRAHPTLGTLLKVGTSVDPDRRCQKLSARRIGPLLDHEHERALKRLLRPFQAWPREPGARFYTQADIFEAPSEWFTATPAVMRLVRAYAKALASP